MICKYNYFDCVGFCLRQHIGPYPVIGPISVFITTRIIKIIMFFLLTWLQHKKTLFVAYPSPDMAFNLDTLCSFYFYGDHPLAHTYRIVDSNIFNHLTRIAAFGETYKSTEWSTFTLIPNNWVTKTIALGLEC